MEIVATDMSGITRALLSDASNFKITPRVNGYADVSLGLDPLDEAARELLIGQRAIRVYDDDGTLRFNGKVWEPLTKSAKTVSVVARDPLAEFIQRRARAEANYTATNNAGGPWDAGQIAYDRLAVQNALVNTYLGAGTRQASANRIRTVVVDQKEGDALDELAGAAGGFFYKARPVDNIAGTLALLDILYPSAGSNREEVRFEYGDGTLDNLADYEQIEMLPLNRMTVSSSATDGGRIAQWAEDLPSQALYGLFEDSTTFSDVTDTTLLLQQAQASIKTSPPLTLKLTPSLDAPLLYTDFNIGDFVRLRIIHGSVDFYGWVRVLEATLDIDENAVRSLSGITVELLTGDQLTVDPDKLFIAQRDEQRRRLEALERRVQDLSVSVGSTPDAGAPGGGGGDTPPPPDPEPEPSPPPAPSEPPFVDLVSADGIYNLGETPSVLMRATVEPNGQATEMWFSLEDGPLSAGEPQGAFKNAGVHQNASNGGTFQEKVSSLAKGHTYYARATAQNASGIARTPWVAVTTPTIAAG